MLSGCSTVDNQFVQKGDVCYRVQTTHVLGVRTNKQTVLAVKEDCTGEGDTP